MRTILAIWTIHNKLDNTYQIVTRLTPLGQGRGTGCCGGDGHALDRGYGANLGVCQHSWPGTQDPYRTCGGWGMVL